MNKIFELFVSSGGCLSYGSSKTCKQMIVGSGMNILNIQTVFQKWRVTPAFAALTTSHYPSWNTKNKGNMHDSGKKCFSNVFNPS